jgi:endonuclease-3
MEEASFTEASLKAKSDKILKILKSAYPPIKTSLKYRNPFELLIATILSAQTTDEAVNEVTKTLFAKYPDAKALSKASLESLEKIVRSAGYFRVKSRNIKRVSQIIVENFCGSVPETMEDLLSLPGVGRKTANIVLSVAFGKLEGIAVDTHVKRLSNRLGLTRNPDPAKIELDLMRIVPKRDWANISILLILHGRNICYARKPNCGGCVISSLCPSAFKFGT